jgi:hypothetical protein
MTRRHEELDEVIDRVAASMTFAPADSTFVARVTDGLRGDTRGAFPWLRVAAVAAAVAIVVAAITVSRDEPDERVVRTAPSRSERMTPAVEAPQVTQATDSHDSAPPSPRQVQRAPRARVQSEAGDVPQIAALPSPDLLAVEELRTHLLTIVPVDLAPLDLGNLAVAEIDVRDDPKE